MKPKKRETSQFYVADRLSSSASNWAGPGVLAAIALAFVVASTAAGSADRGTNLFWKRPVLTAMLILLGLVAFCTYRAYRNLKRAHTALLDGHERFRVHFPLTQERVESALRVLALRVKATCDAEAELYRVGVSNSQGRPVDPEVSLRFAELGFQNRLELAKADLKQALASFWECWHIAQWHDFDLMRSWKPYAGVPWNDSQKAATCERLVPPELVVQLELVEGMNEPAWRDDDPRHAGNP